MIRFGRDTTHKVTITISGEAGSGKTTMALIICQKLAELGIACRIEDENMTDVELADRSDKVELLASTISKLGVEVNVYTRQTRRTKRIY